MTDFDLIILLSLIATVLILTAIGCIGLWVDSLITKLKDRLGKRNGRRT